MEEQTVCLQCGDSGFTNAFIYCVRCLNFALHRYCLPVIPETPNEFVRWFCDDCELEVQSQHPIGKHDVSPYPTRDCKMPKKIEGLSGIMEKNDLAVAETHTDERVHKNGDEQSSNTCAKLDSAECGDQLANQMQLEGKSDGRAEDERERSLQSPSFEGFQEEKNAVMRDQQSDADDSSVPVWPAHGAAWRGKFNIPSLNLDIDIAAHVSKSACSRVLEVASALPGSLCMEMIPRLGALPASFESLPPTEHSAALFFFPDGRDEVVDNLLNHTIGSDFALKSMIGEVELLIFTSVQLPNNLHRLEGKPYFWGVFRGQQVIASHQSDYHVHVRAKQSLSLNSGKHGSSKRKGSPKTTSSENSYSVTQSSKADRRGRRLDNVWEHAKPLDLLRQKAECRYCGFVSSRGGISRLKVHWGGGIPGTHLPGCDKVRPELKKVMDEWSSEWLKKIKALWAKEVKESAAHVVREHANPLNVHIPLQKVHLGGDLNMRMKPRPQVLMSEWLKSLTPSTTKQSQDSVQPETRGRRLDDAWKHTMPLDEVRQQTQCNYCGFVSQYGGISRLKAHLGGGCPQLQLQGCPQVPLEVKSVMEQWFNEWSKHLEASWIRKSHVTQSSKVDRRGRRLDNAWEHAKPLDLSRQKAECRYCGFVSSHGGISRLKIHLGGGIPGTHLPGCDKVPPELKKAMDEWFSEWLKKTKALWAKEVRAEDVRLETRGRRLDDAWKHAMPLDEVRQKARCNYCGFVSEYGGISRLKAHLGGGCPQLQLQGCPQVPLEVKRVMAQWFNEWSKNSTASWIRKSHASPRSSKRKRSLDDTLEYAMLLDETGQETKCKYCGFVSIGGGIARLKTHLAGGDPITQLEGCPNVSPEIKNLMARGGEKKNRKRSKDVTVEPLGGVLQGNGRTLLDPQETLDEISNTSLKGRLQKMIEEKNAKLQKMQFEVQSLGAQLASIP